MNLTITDSDFINGTAVTGGAIYVQGDSNVTMRGVSFQTNEALSKGGALYAEDFSKVEIGGSSRFIGNKALEKGGALYSECEESK